VARRRRYRLADTAQQIVGGFLLAGPFVVTEEVWLLADSMTVWHSLATVAVVAAIGYGALYEADDGRDVDTEQVFGGVPVRFLSLMLVSYGSVLVLAVVLTAPSTFAAAAGVPEEPIPLARLTMKAVGIGALFSVVGAATADSVF